MWYLSVWKGLSTLELYNINHINTAWLTKLYCTIKLPLQTQSLLRFTLRVWIKEAKCSSKSSLLQCEFCFKLSLLCKGDLMKTGNRRKGYGKRQHASVLIIYFLATGEIGLYWSTAVIFKPFILLLICNRGTFIYRN